MKRITMRVTFLALALSALAFACTGESLDAIFSGSGEGQLTVNVHDQVGPGISEAFVTVTGLEVRSVETGGWVTVPMNGNRTFDLLLLVNGNEATVASTPIPEGQYDGMRASISQVRVTLDDGTSIDVPDPAGPVEVLAFPTITVTEGGSVTLTLDFPVDTSFQVIGTSVIFNPQLTFESVTTG